MDERVLIELFCGCCRSRFFVCERDFRGQRYCQDVCRGRGQRKVRQAANARYQRSPDGLADHRDRNRALRKRKSDATCVTDEGSKKLASVAPLPTPDHLPSATEVDAQSDGQGMNDEAIQVDSVCSARPDAVVAVGRVGRDHESGSAVRDLSAPPTRVDDNVGGFIDVAGHQAARCCAADALDNSYCPELVDDLGGVAPSVFFEVEIAPRVRRPGRRIKGVGQFRDLKQMHLSTAWSR